MNTRSSHALPPLLDALAKAKARSQTVHVRGHPQEIWNGQIPRGEHQCRALDHKDAEIDACDDGERCLLRRESNGGISKRHQCCRPTAELKPCGSTGEFHRRHDWRRTFKSRPKEPREIAPASEGASSGCSGNPRSARRRVEAHAE